MQTMENLLIKQVQILYIKLGRLLNTLHRLSNTTLIFAIEHENYTPFLYELIIMELYIKNSTALQKMAYIP